MSQVLNVLGKVMSSRRFCSHGSLLVRSPLKPLRSTPRSSSLNFVELSVDCAVNYCGHVTCHAVIVNPHARALKNLAVSIETPKHVLLEIQRAGELELVAGLTG